MKNVLKFVWLFFGLFFSIVWIYIQMLIWQPWICGKERLLLADVVDYQV
jgi:hypothetical protein